PLIGVDGKEKSKTRAQQRAAGTKKTALFDRVNRNYAATHSVPAERAKSHVARRPSRVPAATCGGKPILRFANFSLGPGSRSASLHSPGTRERRLVGDHPRAAQALNHFGAIAS